MCAIKRKKRIVGALILIFSYGFIAYRISQFHLKFEKISLSKYLFLLIGMQLLLSSLNILTEAKKWKLLLSSIAKPSIISAVKMILAGYASGIFTPAKLGEPVGRILFLDKPTWSRATVLNYFGGFLQNVVIFILGFSFIAFLSFTKQPQFKTIFLYGFGSVLLVTLVVVLIYFLKNYLGRYISRLKWKLTFNLMFEELKQISFLKFLKLQSLSLLRYLIYSFQLILLFLFFTDFALCSDAILYVPVYFLCITLVPSFLLADLGVRNSVALLLFSAFCMPQSGVILSVSILWILNQAIPAILGSIFIYKQSRS